MKISDYYTTVEAAAILKRSIRSTNYHLRYLFDDDDINTDKENPTAFKRREGKVLKCYYRKDMVYNSINKKRPTKYKRKCKQCNKQFKPTSNEAICKECIAINNEPLEEYDITAVKALLLVLENDAWYRKATRFVIVGWLVALAIILGGCLYEC